MVDIRSNADEKTVVFGILKISYYSNFSESRQFFISPSWQFSAASCEGKSRMERFYRQHKWHSRMQGTSVPRKRESTWEGYYECETLRGSQQVLINNLDSRIYGIAWPGLMFAHRMKLGEIGQGRQSETSTWKNWKGDVIHFVCKEGQS